MTTNYLRLSDHKLSQKWLSQFRTANDRAIASQLLNQFKLVSGREFESTIEQALIDLRNRTKSTIAVYPILPPIPNEIAGYDPFNGGIPKVSDSDSREIGRRRQYGSEDRVGHFLSKLQQRYKKGTGVSEIECAPTLKQLKTQKIEHIVLVDDVCGSGTRIENYWKIIPRGIKSLLSLKKCQLWIVLYGITPSGRKALKSIMPNFPIDTHLITILPDADLLGLLSPEQKKLCRDYAQIIGMETSSFGYKGSAFPVIFEHGCPNNLPVIIWFKSKFWKGLFPNRAIPTEMRDCFDDVGTERLIETLWRSNQPSLALGLLEKIDNKSPLILEYRLIMILLGISMRGVKKTDLARRMMISDKQCNELLDKANQMCLYDISSSTVTNLGKEFLARFREIYKRNNYSTNVAKDSLGYYPYQCEGKLKEPGKTILTENSTHGV